jgi:hypothetical protein
MAQSSPTRYPAFYRIFFTWMDPIVCVWGAYMDFFDPTLVLSSHIPNLPHDIGHAMILRQRGGGMLQIGFLSAVLLRHTTELTIWRIVQASCLLVDIAYFVGAFGALSAQGRLGWQSWRAEDWGALAITGAATLARTMFLMGVGLEDRKRTAKRS